MKESRRLVVAALATMGAACRNDAPRFTPLATPRAAVDPRWGGSYHTLWTTRAEPEAMVTADALDGREFTTRLEVERAPGGGESALLDVPFHVTRLLSRDDGVWLVGVDSTSTVVARVELALEPAPQVALTELLLRLPAIGVVGDAEWLDPQRELLLLLDRERAVLWRVDPRNGDAQPIADATRFPAMATMKSFNAFRPAGGPPLVVFLCELRPTADMLDPHAPSLLLVDDDGDDRFDREATEAEDAAW